VKNNHLVNNLLFYQQFSVLSKKFLQPILNTFQNDFPEAKNNISRKWKYYTQKLILLIINFTFYFIYEKI